MMFICFLIAPVPSLRPAIFSTTESDERIKIGLTESGKKEKKKKRRKKPSYFIIFDTVTVCMYYIWLYVVSMLFVPFPLLPFSALPGGSLLDEIRI